MMRTRQNPSYHHRLTTEVISITLGILLGVNRAHAQSAVAEKLFNDGNKLMAGRRIAEACAAFEASNRVEPRAGTLLRLGECREKNQQLASAWSAYKDARNLATDPRKRRFAGTKAAALEPRLSYLTVAVSNHIRVQGLVLTRDGTSFDPVLWNRALPVDGGDYVMTGRAPGYETWQRTVHVPWEGAKLSIDVPALTKAGRVTLAEAPSPRTPSKSPATSLAPSVVAVPVQQNLNVAAPPPPSVVGVPTLDHSPMSPSTSRKIVPVVIGTGALVLLGGGLGLELWAESRYAAAKSEMTSQLRRDSLYNSANTRRYVAEGLAMSGFAAGGAAVWLYLRDDKRERDTTANAGVQVVPTATGLALSGQF